MQCLGVKLDSFMVTNLALLCTLWRFESEAGEKSVILSDVVEKNSLWATPGSWVIASSLGLVFRYNNFFESEVKI